MTDLGNGQQVAGRGGKAGQGSPSPDHPLYKLIVYHVTRYSLLISSHRMASTSVYFLSSLHQRVLFGTQLCGHTSCSDSQSNLRVTLRRHSRFNDIKCQGESACDCYDALLSYGTPVFFIEKNTMQNRLKGKYRRNFEILRFHNHLRFHFQRIEDIKNDSLSDTFIQCILFFLSLYKYRGGVLSL